MRPYDLRICELGLALAAQPTVATDYPHALIPKFFELSADRCNERAGCACICLD
jgi:hypothetical protein